MDKIGYKKSLPLSNLPDNQSVETEIENMAIMLHRRGGEVFATGVYCPHAEVRLDPKNCDGDLIICKAHGYKSNIKTGVCLNEPDLRLNTFPTVIEGGFVWVKMF